MDSITIWSKRAERVAQQILDARPPQFAKDWSKIDPDLLYAYTCRWLMTLLALRLAHSRQQAECLRPLSGSELWTYVIESPLQAFEALDEVSDTYIDAFEVLKACVEGLGTQALQEIWNSCALVHCDVDTYCLLGGI